MAVELRKGQKVNLRKKRSESLGEILINLNWSQPQGNGGSGILGGLFSKKPKAIDLDLGCLYELVNGDKGSVQALGNNFGSLTYSPYVALDGDDRSGANTEGENLRVNGKHVADIKRILVYTFIYEGVTNWKEADGIVTVKYPGGDDIIVHMDEYGSNQGMCAIAIIENYQGETFSVEKLVRFFDGHQPMDHFYHWGLKWHTARK